MSYSFDLPCYNCKKEKLCTDKDKVKAAIDDIHSECASSEGSGHKGAGTIMLMCCRCETTLED